MPGPARERPSRTNRPSFFLTDDDSHDDFFLAPPSPFSPTDEGALLPHSADDHHHRPSSSSSNPDVFADPTSAPNSSQGHSGSSADYYRLQQQQASPGASLPLAQPQPSHAGPFGFRYRASPPISPPQPGYPPNAAPSAYGPVPRDDVSPGLHSRRNSGDITPSGFHSPPAAPFARPAPFGRTSGFTEMSRTSSATSFAPPPLPWLRDGSASPSRSGSSTPVGEGGMRKKPKHFTSTLLREPVAKPWLQKPDKWARAGQWITRLFFLIGVLASAALCFFGWTSIDRLGNLCVVLDDDFSGGLNTDTWQREVEMGGFGNGEFQWTTANDANSFVDGNQLFIVPTLTSDVIGMGSVLDGYKVTLSDCTSQNKSACSASSSAQAKTVINPVQSARLTTRLSKSIRYGKVEVRARLPKGDWLWPAIWMMPLDSAYGPWPMSGEIDIAEARGNGITYGAQGSNFVSSTLHWSPSSTPNLDAWQRTWGWITMRRSSYADDFHTYSLEWDDKFMRFYVDQRTTGALSLSFKKQDFFKRGDFPQVIQNGSTQSVLNNPWSGSGNSAPFDQQFYLILDVAAGGTNGWFPDNVGGKPWFDGSGPAAAMYDFAHAQSSWGNQWPSDPKDRAMVVDSVKMWQTC